VEVESSGVTRAQGNLNSFSQSATKAGKSTDDLANRMGALQLIANKLPGPLNAIASGLMGLVSPATAAVSAIMEVVSSQIKLSQESEELYIKQEVNLARLGAVLEATGAKTWTTTNNLKYMADSIRQETGRSTDEIMRMQSVLLGFTGITGENFERLTRNMVNMADVMGGDLASSANIFGRALENPAESLNALTRQGFVFTEEQKRMVKQLDEAGRLEEAQVVYLEAMERAFGDSAKATREAAKSVNDYKQALEDLKLARGEFEASGGMTWQRFWREFTLPGIRDQAETYREETQRRQNDIYYGDLNKRADEVANNYLQTVKTAEELIAIFESGKADINDLLRAVMMKFGDGSKDMGERLQWQNTYNGLQKYIEEYNRIQEEAKRIAAEFEKNKKDYDSSVTKINIEYDDTSEGKSNKIEREIAKWKELREKTWEVDTGVFKGLSDENKRMIDIIIKDLQEGGKKVKGELTSWQKIFQSAMNLSDDDTKKDWFQRQTTAINKFVQMTATAQERAKILASTIGTDITGSLEKAAEQWEQLASEMILSGEWQENSELFLQVVEYAREARTELADANLDNLIKDLDKELSLMRMTTQEVEKQKLLSEYKYGNENKIIEALEKQQKLRRDQQRLNTLSGATGISEEFLQGLSGEELGKKIDSYMSIKREDAKYFSEIFSKNNLNGLDEYSDELSSIADKWEDIYKIITSATTEKDGVVVQLFDPTLEENAELIENIRKNMLASREDSNAALFDKDKKALELQKESIWLSEEELRIKELITQYDDEAKAKEIAALEQQIEKTLALKEALQSLAQASLQITTSGLVDFAHDLGSAFRDGTISSDELSSAFGNMLKAMIDAMPQLLLNVGLQLIMAKQWALGLAFIGASGLMSFVSGMIDDSEDSGKDDEAERLRRIQEQITDLIEQQRRQEEYYYTKKRNVNASAINVNDAIITPQGTVYTHPEDYIIATKKPESLMSGGGAGNVFINIENNAPVKVNTETETTEDGSKMIKMTIEQVVQSGIANGTFDSAFNAMNNRRSGRRIQN